MKAGRGMLAALVAIFVATGAASPALAAPRDIIAVMSDQQAAIWRGIVIDMNVVGEYYADPANGSIWVSGGKPTTAAQEFYDAAAAAGEDGLLGGDYMPAVLAEAGVLADEEDAAGYELAMSQAFLSFAHDLHAGVTAQSVTQSNIVIPRKPVDAIGWLTMARQLGVKTTLNHVRPQHPQYYQLRQMLRGYRDLAARGGWPKISEGPTLKPGMTDPRVAEMRANLLARGYGNIEGRDAPDVYDETLSFVVQHFQRRHGLDVDGVAGPKTIAAMNVSAEERVNEIVINLERWRWLPVELGGRHVFVNQAGFEMFLSDEGTTLTRHKVIVGKPFNQTPMFSDKIAYADFNPTWTVTPSIAVTEFLPKLRQDPGYLARNDYLLYAGWGAGAPLVDPWSVNWHAVSPSNFPYRIVQQPGPKNALGVVKFMFPNAFTIYLHDTPSRQLFAETGRAFSHGCIRVQEPVKFAEILFGLDGSLNPDQIKKLIDRKKIATARLKRKIPVHLTYFTVWIDDDGLPNFFPDIYERDELVGRLLFGAV